jgi:two-component system, NtrC family, response regulator AtoC
MTPGSVLDPHTLFDEATGTQSAGTEPLTLTSFLQDCERRYLLQELTRHEWQMGETAKAIGISRKNLWERLRRLELQVPGRTLREDSEQEEV